MNPSYIYFKELDIDKDDNFTLNFSKDNEIENVVFDKDYEYAVTGLKINVELPEGQVIKIDDQQKLEQKSNEIQGIIKNYKEPDLTFYISTPETLTIQILFVKKSEADLPRIKYTYYNITSKKKEDFLVYDHIDHLKNYGFNWEDDTIGLRYFIKINGTKTQRRLTMKAQIRKMILVDEQKIFNLHFSVKSDLSDANKKFLSILIAYLWNPIKITGDVFDFTSLTKKKKKKFISKVFSSIHYGKKPNSDNFNFFASFYYNNFAVLFLKSISKYIFHKSRINRLFVRRFYHDRRRDKNFLKHLRFIRKHEPRKAFLNEPIGFGRAKYEYQDDINIPNSNATESLNADDNEFPFPEKFYKNIGFSINGFLFTFNNAQDDLKIILNPSVGLINDRENNIEVVDKNFTKELFLDEKSLLDKIAEYKAIPTKDFINESFFLYDKSNTIKKTFITALNKQLSIYGSFSYFSGNTAIKNLKLLDIANSLKFLVKKKALKENLKLQIAYVSGSEVKTEDQKIHEFSISQLGKRRKNMLSEPAKTVIIRAQPDFDVVGGLNPIQVQIVDEMVLNILRKYKNVAYKITPLGILFPASITNDTNHIFVTATKISGAKKATLNYKIYDILADIDTDKINKWKDIGRICVGKRSI